MLCRLQTAACGQQCALQVKNDTSDIVNQLDSHHSWPY